jgi:hypothetical protein
MGRSLIYLSYLRDWNIPGTTSSTGRIRPRSILQETSIAHEKKFDFFHPEKKVKIKTKIGPYNAPFRLV